MKQKKYVYADELNDDFAASRGKIKRKKIDAGYKYIHKSAIWKTASFVIYRMIATPLGYISMRVFKGLKIKNRKALGKVKGGFFLYGNHTQGWGDAFAPTLACFPEKVHVVVGAEAVSLPVVGHVAHMAGGLPLPSDTMISTVKIACSAIVTPCQTENVPNSWWTQRKSRTAGSFPP